MYIATASTNWSAGLTEPAVRVYEKAVELLPNILGAIALIVIGWLLARILRVIVTRLINFWLDRLHKSGFFPDRFQRGSTNQAMPTVLSGVVYWIVLIFFLAAGIEALGLPAVSDILNRATVYLPQVFVAALIVFAGLFLGELTRSFVSRAASRTGIAFADLIGRSMQIVIIVVAAMIAIDQLGIDSMVLTITLGIAVGAAFGATALAFGLGAGPTVSNIIAAHYVHRSYRVGNTIRIGDMRGAIVEITRTGVVLDTPDGRALIPAKRFADEESILVSDGK